MVNSTVIYRYFPDFSEAQKAQFDALYNLYIDHNSRINVISRKDMDNFYIHHVLHSLALLKFADFRFIESIIDIGTGGGFPGIPLAIVFPEIEFHLVDSIGKKITVVKAVAESIGLKNVTAEQIRVEQTNFQYDMAVARAVAPTKELYDWMQQQWTGEPNFALLKGGDLSEELSEVSAVNKRLKIKSHSISSVFDEPFFETKKVVTLKSR
jgi:16S rRNA (guanine527-N7)-methyltransferase